MSFLINLLGFFWLIRTIKFVFFWIYLWQLKEYHIGRFIDHFRTHKGKKLLINYWLLTKIILLVFLLTDYFWIAIYALLLIYILESFNFLKNVTQRNFIKPKFTFKAAFLTSVSVILSLLFLFKAKNSQNFTASLLLLDIFLPIIISFIALFFQPLFVFWRNRIIKKAKEKIRKFIPPAGGLIVVGLTGSYGKTSTKEFLTTILSHKFNVLATPEHQNSEMGIAQCILNSLNEDHQIFVVEMAAYKKGGISLLCDIVKPKIGMVTGVNQQHLATFGSMENLLSAEGGLELLENLSKDGLLVVNGNNKYCLELYKKALRQAQGKPETKVYTVFGDRIESDVWTQELSVNKDSLDFLVLTKDKQAVHFNIAIIGGQNVQNLLAAILVAQKLSMSLEEISLASKNIKPEQAGITIKEGIREVDIIDSSYSSNPDGVMADLDYLNIYKDKKIVIMPCLIELGSQSAEIHQQIGKKIAQVCDLAIITTKDKFEEIKTGAIINGMSEDKIIFSDKPKEVLNKVVEFCQEGNAILLEGRVPKELINLLVVK